MQVMPLLVNLLSVPYEECDLGANGLGNIVRTRMKHTYQGVGVSPNLNFVIGGVIKTEVKD